MITDTLATYEFSGELAAAMERGIDRMAGELLELSIPVPAALELSAQTARLAVTHHPLGKPGGPGLFHKKGLQLPAYIQQIAHALLRTGRAATESRAIQLAIGVCKRWARGGGKVSPEVQAAAQAAIAEWEKDKALSVPAGSAIELAGVYTEALHPRAAGGKFGAKPTSAAPAKSGGKLVSEPIGGDGGRKAQLHALADQDRQVAHGLLLQVRDLQHQLHALRHPGGGKAAGGGTAGAPGKNAAPGKKTARSSTKTKAGKHHNKTKKKATPVSKEASLSGRIKSLTSDARKLMAAADRLDKRAASI